MKGLMEKFGFRRGDRSRKKKHPQVTDASKKEQRVPENRSDDDDPDGGPQHYIPLPRRFR